MKKIYDGLNDVNVIGMTTFMDRLLFVSLIVFSAASFFFMREMLPTGKLVRIKLDNRTVYALSLYEDRAVSVRGPLGDNVIEIKDGRVRMKDAPCPRKLCVHQGWIDRGTITCLPNRITVTVNGDSPHPEDLPYDAVTE